jgi:hypothetical protein
MHMKTRLILVMMLASFVAAVGLVATAEGTSSPLGIVPGPVPSSLTVSVWTDKSTYSIGETLRVFFTVSQPAYVYLYDLQPDGVVRLVFPNAYSQANYVSQGTHSLPDAAYQFTVTPPTGTEKLQIFASLSPLALAPNAYGEPFPEIASTPDAARGILEPHIMGIVPTSGVATAWTSFLIAAPTYGVTPYPSYPPMPPFFSWFPGGGWYWQDGQWYWGNPANGWWWYFGPDGQWHMEIHFHFGN